MLPGLAALQAALLRDAYKVQANGGAVAALQIAPGEFTTLQEPGEVLYSMLSLKEFLLTGFTVT